MLASMPLKWNRFVNKFHFKHAQNQVDSALNYARKNSEQTHTRFFFNQVINSHNELPQYLTDSDSINSFKNGLDNYWTIMGYGYIQRPPAYDYTPV